MTLLNRHKLRRVALKVHCIFFCVIMFAVQLQSLQNSAMKQLLLTLPTTLEELTIEGPTKHQRSLDEDFLPLYAATTFFNRLENLTCLSIADYQVR